MYATLFMGPYWRPGRPLIAASVAPPLQSGD
jgi:hypothetical protein